MNLKHNLLSREHVSTLPGKGERDKAKRSRGGACRLVHKQGIDTVHDASPTSSYLSSPFIADVEPPISVSTVVVGNIAISDAKEPLDRSVCRDAGAMQHDDLPVPLMYIFCEMDSYAQFLQRLVSFNAVQWVMHRVKISPLTVARCGWEARRFNVLFCEVCQQQFHFYRKSISTDPDQLQLRQVEDFLQRQHDNHCIWRVNIDPSTFEHLQLFQTEKTSRDFLSRFDALNVLWDLPLLKEPTLDNGRQNALESLFEFLYSRHVQSLDAELLTQFDQDLKRRVRCQMLLALLGWNLKWVPKFVYRLNTNGLPRFTEGRENDPTTSGIAYGRQCFLKCPLCQGTMGLWSCDTFSDVTHRDFLRLHQRHCIASTPSLDLSSTVRKGQKTREEKESSAVRFAIADKPVFGMKRFARVASSTMNDLEESRQKKRLKAEDNEARESDAFSMCYSVTTGKQIDPVKGHRYFCPYRFEWQSLLKTFTGS